MSLASQELGLLNKLGDVWNEFCELEVMHPYDLDEFQSAIHSRKDRWVSLTS